MNVEKLKQAEKLFFKAYPGGFDHPEMEQIKKKHKPEKMHQLAKESFGKENFKKIDEVIANMVKIISRSSMVSVFEKPKFKEFAVSLSHSDKKIIVNGLEDLLHGDQELGFNAMLGILEKAKLAKWTLMTIIPVYYYPKKEVYVKPTTVRGVIDFYEIENLVYKPKPTFEFYKKYRTIINEMKKQVDKSLGLDNAAFSGFLMMSMEK